MHTYWSYKWGGIWNKVGFPRLKYRNQRNIHGHTHRYKKMKALPEATCIFHNSISGINLNIFILLFITNVTTDVLRMLYVCMSINICIFIHVYICIHIKHIWNDGEQLIIYSLCYFYSPWSWTLRLRMNYLITEYLNTNWNINNAIEILCTV